MLPFSIGFGQRVRAFIPLPIGGRFEFAGINSGSMSPEQDPFNRYETRKYPANSKRPQIEKEPLSSRTNARRVAATKTAVLFGTAAFHGRIFRGAALKAPWQ